MTDKEKKLFERMEWYQGHGLPSAGLLDALDPVSGTGLRQPGASTVGNSEDWFAVLIGQRIDLVFLPVRPVDIL